MEGNEPDPNNCTTAENGDYSGIHIAFPVALSSLGILGNVIALFSLWKQVRHTVFYTLVSGLVWADLLGITITTPPVLASYISGHWVGGKLLCEIHAYAMVLFGTITPFTVTTLAIERLFAVRYTYYHARCCTPMLARFVLLILWTTAITFSALPFVGIGHFSLQYPCTWCFLSIQSRGTTNAYASVFATINLTAIVITIVCNVFVQSTILKMRRQWQSDDCRRSEGKVQQVETQMVVILVMMSAAFAICWAPFMIRILQNQWTGDVLDQGGDLIVVRLASFHQIIDPWLYILCRRLPQLHHCTITH